MLLFLWKADLNERARCAHAIHKVLYCDIQHNSSDWSLSAEEGHRSGWYFTSNKEMLDQCLAEGHNGKTVKALFGAAPVRSQSPALPPVPMWRWRLSPSPLRPPSRGSGNSSVSLESAGQRVARPLSAAKFRNRNSSVNSALSRRVKCATTPETLGM